MSDWTERELAAAWAPKPTIQRWRITIRADQPRAELRGFLDADMKRLEAFARALEPFGLVLASPADPDVQHTEGFVWR